MEGFKLSNKKPSSLMKVVNIVFESIEFIILSYLLLSSMYSFRTNVVYILFFAVDVVVIGKFYTKSFLFLDKCSIKFF